MLKYPSWNLQPVNRLKAIFSVKSNSDLLKMKPSWQQIEFASNEMEILAKKRLEKQVNTILNKFLSWKFNHSINWISHGKKVKNARKTRQWSNYELSQLKEWFDIKYSVVKHDVDNQAKLSLFFRIKKDFGRKNSLTKVSCLKLFYSDLCIPVILLWRSGLQRGRS